MADPNVETTARNIGWVPQEEFRGDPEKWVDAGEFVRRGEEVMPILKATNKRLQSDLENTNRALAEVKETLRASQEAIAALKEYQTVETRRQVEAAKAGLKESLAAAREAGDHTMASEIEDQLLDIKVAEKTAAKPAPAPPAPVPGPAAPAPQAEHPEFTAWKKENPWFLTDKRKTAIMMAEAQDMREDPEHKDLVGRAFFEEAKRRTELFFDPGHRASKVDGGGLPPGGGGGDGGGKTPAGYRDLPADAKAACDGFEKRMVGKGKAFPDQAAWRKHYVEQYNAT